MANIIFDREIYYIMLPQNKVVFTIKSIISVPQNQKNKISINHKMDIDIDFCMEN